ncbi:3-hydroxyacyl-CoA dehydrogenase [Taibaiella sp. KBW10]|uniref:3-hydroxyacyl-CoA dehydrogenase/enoyl-CoA hydratase family protein n=1 Tax=Taibaiella sp. KBW10 TaxID=2153357 RepID=UPI000F5B10DC|nr:3-hydroxyacyl-CoA dehydrogenase/enoyl-CoA hydratase family protein [Taibaiella sp. KBW10]RQO32591.1 3-hydroxyacyl-CoA dehydrogenase [Taibaiella sp. KBW10]
MRNRTIEKVAVLGSGVMGSRIACHFANIGLEVLLLDIVPKDAPQGDPKVRNKIVNDALAFALKSNPSPIYSKRFAQRIRTGNFEDDMHRIADCDWVIEVVVERLDIKQQVFEKVEAHRKPGSLITSNTSGIPIHLMTEGRSEDFKQHFCGTHFFNPPRYLKLLEIIPTKDTLAEVTGFLMQYGEQYLGKTTVLAKDTPAFIGNRIGVFSMMSLLQYVQQSGMSIEAVDKLTGPVVGRPKSATFRTADVVGIDTLALVADSLVQNVPGDEGKDSLKVPDFVRKMIENKWLGSKTEQGFFKKVKGEGGKSEIHALDLKTLEYKPAQKVKFAALEASKPIDDLKQRLKLLVNFKDEAGAFYRATLYPLFVYSANRIPEISDELYKIDDAIKAGYGWELGPFETWDALGVAETVHALKEAGHGVPGWVIDMLAGGNNSFYKIEDGKRLYYDIPSKTYKIIPGTEAFILLDHIRESKTIWKNSGSTITDLGDGILNLEFHTKMNSIGGEVLEGINKAIDLAEQEYKGLVVSNNGANFSAGANVGMIFMMAVEQEFDELDFAIRQFQSTMMRIRYSAIPVVAAPHNMALGGGCELCLHADKVVAHAETYMGLVEFGVGLIPGGGGTKEFAVRISDELKEGDVALNTYRDRFLTIGQAKVSTSAEEAFELGYLRRGTDKVVVSYNRLLAEAKEACLEMVHAGYVKPQQRKDITVLGKTALGLAYLGANAMYSGNYISEHDVKISQKLGYVLAGGDLSQATQVSEQYLLNLERQAFLSLAAERKTLERIQSILNGGKVLRN